MSLANFLVTLTDQELQRVVAQQAVDKALPINKARSLARKLAAEKGLPIGRRVRRPSDDLMLIQSVIGRLQGDLERLVEIPINRLTEMFAPHDKRYIKELLECFDERAEELNEFHANLKTAVAALQRKT